ncbi:unnamed protein product, partial [Durusdinium trenchii]
LVEGGIRIAGPPCSLFVAASQSVHRRSVSNLNGNLQNAKVRCSNRIWTNFAVCLLVLHRIREDVKIVLEQPSSSWAFKLPKMLQVSKKWNLSRVTTWMGAFGHDLLKCSHLLLNLSNGEQILGRKMSAAKRKVIKERFLKRQERRRNKKEYYRQSSNGSWNGGKDLASSAAYTAGFCTALLKAWRA